MSDLLIELMMNLSTGMLLVAITVAATRVLTGQNIIRWGAVLVVLVLALLIPIDGSNVWFWVNGAIGQLSIVSLVLLAGFITRHLLAKDVLAESSRIQLQWLILISGLLLYPASLGLSMFDPYSLGFSFVLPLILLLLAVIYWHYQYYSIALILLVVVAAAGIPLADSLNAWDYFIDPLIWLLSPVSIIILVIRRKSLRREQQSRVDLD